MLHGRRAAPFAFDCTTLCLIPLPICRLALPPCQGWIRADRGYIQGHEGCGHNMHTICNSDVWGPRVASRDIDVNAFIG